MISIVTYVIKNVTFIFFSVTSKKLLVTSDILSYLLIRTFVLSITIVLL